LQLIPAIDLMNGNVVRLSRGDPATAKVYAQWGTPLQVSLKWKAEGAKRLHIIDLDAAFSNGNNHQVIAEIASTISLPIQVGGGIRSVDTAAKLLKMGVRQVILGTVAFTKTEVIDQIQKEFGPESVIVALDHEGGRVKVHGWTNPKAHIVPDRDRRRKSVFVSSVNVKKAMEKFTPLGVERFLITSIAKDGMLSGPDIHTLSEAVKFPSVKIIAAGGIGSMNDLVALKRVGVEGAVIGKALYEGRFTLREAIEKIGD
jgi:phosphoribosylformimino-5-aminoimidazole carboxamide ribotide isomerase